MPLACWCSRTYRIPRSIDSRYGPGSPGTCPAARNAMTDQRRHRRRRPEPARVPGPIGPLRRPEVLEHRWIAASDGAAPAAVRSGPADEHGSGRGQRRGRDQRQQLGQRWRRRSSTTPPIRSTGTSSSVSSFRNSWLGLRVGGAGGDLAEIELDEPGVVVAITALRRSGGSRCGGGRGVRPRRGRSCARIVSLSSARSGSALLPGRLWGSRCEPPGSLEAGVGGRSPSATRLGRERGPATRDSAAWAAASRSRAASRIASRAAAIGLVAWSGRGPGRAAGGAAMTARAPRRAADAPSAGAVAAAALASRRLARRSERRRRGEVLGELRAALDHLGRRGAGRRGRRAIWPCARCSAAWSMACGAWRRR